MTDDNVSHRFDRLPTTVVDREIEGRPTRQEVLEWWETRFGISAEIFEEYSFWEKGGGKIWISYCDVADGLQIESLGMRVMHTRQEHWKPTTNAVQRFGKAATRNVLTLTDEQARQFVAGDSQDIDWDGDWGYLIVSKEIAGEPEPLGVGLYTYGELASQIPKGRRRDLH